MCELEAIVRAIVAPPLPLFQRLSSRVHKLQVVSASPPCRDYFEVLSMILLLLKTIRLSSLRNANICRCGRLRVHLLYQIKHIRFMVR